MLPDNCELAINYHEEALRIRERLYGLHPTLGQGYNNICEAYERAGNYKKAQECCRKGLHLKSMLVTRNSETVLKSLLNLSDMTYKYDGNASKALRLLDEAYDIRKVLGLNHPSTSLIWISRGNIYHNLENYHQASSCLSKAVDGLLKTGGHPRMLSEALIKWGIALKKTGNLIEAEQRLRWSLKVTQKLAEDGDIPEEEEDTFKDALWELSEIRDLAQSKH